MIKSKVSQFITINQANEKGYCAVCNFKARRNREHHPCNYHGNNEMNYRNVPAEYLCALKQDHRDVLEGDYGVDRHGKLGKRYRGGL